MKIAIIGYSGAGKSTLAEKLSNFYSIPKLHIDRLQFKPGWKDSNRDWILKKMKTFLSKHEDWVIDGNYTWCSYEERMEQADQIIFLNFSAWNCLARAFKRYLRYRGKVRESMADGCPERFDWEFIRWILWDGRNSSHKDHYQQICSAYADKVTIITNQKELDCFLHKKERVGQKSVIR